MRRSSWGGAWRPRAGMMAPRFGRREMWSRTSHRAWKTCRSRSFTSPSSPRGSLNSPLVHPREVFREAIAERAAAIILVHNHPSGDPTPSADDRLVTEQLVAAGRLLDIPVPDHGIICPRGDVSFAGAGL